MAKTFAEMFNEYYGEWREHCRSNSTSPDSRAYLDCKAFRDIVAMGEIALPLVRDRLRLEIETRRAYDEAEGAIKRRIFGTDSVDLSFGKEFEKALDDSEFYEHVTDRYERELAGQPGSLWCNVVHEIVGSEFDKDIQGRFIPGNVPQLMKACLDWLVSKGMG